MSDKAYDIIMDERKMLTESFLEMMSQGHLPWKKEWQISGSPYNPVSGCRYRGGNYLKLLMVGMTRGYGDPRWVTFKQAAEVGMKVKKGSKGICLEKWIFEQRQKVTAEDGSVTYETVRLTHPKVAYFTVFNAEQVDGMPPIEKPPRLQEDDEKNQLADRLIASSECPIQECTSDRAYYSLSADHIVLPKRENFMSMDAFVSTMLHEMGHSTGHPTRLNRQFGRGFGSSDYAREELRAELSAAFSCTEFGIRTQDLDRNHAAYLQSWIAVLQNDPNELYRAAADADKMSDRIVGRYRDMYPDLLPTIEKMEMQIRKDLPAAKSKRKSKTL